MDTNDSSITENSDLSDENILCMDNSIDDENSESLSTNNNDSTNLQTSENTTNLQTSENTTNLETSNDSAIASTKTSTLKQSKIEYSNMTTTAIANSNIRNGEYFYMNLTDSNGNPLKNQRIMIGFNGKIYNRTTNETGGAKLQINLITPRGYTFAVCYLGDDTYYGSFIVAKITVVKNSGTASTAKATVSTSSSNTLSTLKSSMDNSLNYSSNKAESIIEYYNMNTTAIPNLNLRTGEYFSINLTDANGNPLANKKISIGFNGKIYNRTTNETGGAKLQINLGYTGVNTFAVCFLGDDGYVGSFIVAKITVVKNDVSIKVNTEINSTSAITSTVSYSKYGVSSDGKTLMAIGRASATGELSVYGYTFYKTIFKRTCPFCGSSELYWYIFWAGNETANYGTFPATGHKEGGSAEGQIFCAACDADFSCLTGKDHGSGNKHLTIISGPTNSSKAEAYKLRNGTMKVSVVTSSIDTIKIKTTLKSKSGDALINKTVSITINGKTYTGKTDSNGLVSITVSLTANKIYSYTVKFAGDNQNNALTSTGKIVLS